MSNEVPTPSYMQAEERRKKAADILDKVDAEQAKKEKHVEKVVQGKTSTRKKPMAKRVSEAMLGEDVQEVKSYLLWDVFIPAIKDTIVDLIKKGTDAMFYGGTEAPSNVKRRDNYSRPSYSNYYEWRRNERDKYERRSRRPAARAVHRFDDILFSDRRDAEIVLSNLVDITMDYGMVSVADFYELAGEESEYTDNKYGWGELSTARVVRTRDGYILDLPRPEPID